MGKALKTVCMLAAVLCILPVSAGMEKAGAIWAAEQAERAEDAEDFVIRNGVLKKYKGKAADVVIPDGVKTIGKNAFVWNGTMVSVYIPDSVTKVGEGAFWDCSVLESVEGGKNVTVLEDGAFGLSDKLAHIDVSNIEYIGAMAFCGCRALESVDLDAVKEIGGEAFAKSGIARVSGMQHLERVLGGEFFRSTPFAENYGKEQGENALFIVNGILLFAENCSGDLIIPEGVREIPANAFCENGRLCSVTLPGTLERIGDSAFFKCTRLKYVTMEDSVTEIGAWAFSQCVNLREIRLSNALTKLPYGLFYHCRRLQSLTLPENLEAVDGNYLLWMTHRVRAVTVPADAAYLPDFFLGYRDTEGKLYYDYAEGKGLEEIKDVVLYAAGIKEGSYVWQYAQEHGLALKELELTAQKVTLTAGEKYMLRFNSGAKAEWKSSDRSVAYVGRTGNIYARKPGTAVVTATIYGKEYTCEVTVK